METNLIGESIILIEKDEQGRTVECEGEIVAADLGSHTFMIAMKEGPRKGHIFGFNNWTNLRLTRFHREA
jgi:hypothetical protein